MREQRFEAFAEAYCFIHGSVQLASHLQGKASPCRVSDAEDFRSNYYLWIPYIFPLAIIVAYIPFLMWEQLYEMGMMKMLLADRTPKRICKRFKILRFV